jgi:hypothetical protein
MAKKENAFQSGLIKDLKDRFPGCIVTKLDSSHIQGIPDLLVLWNDKWATLEVKRERGAKHQPNQDYYVGRMNEMSFSSFIFPENKEEVLNEMEHAFQSNGTARIFGS